MKQPLLFSLLLSLALPLAASENVYEACKRIPGMRHELNEAVHSGTAAQQAFVKKTMESLEALSAVCGKLNERKQSFLGGLRGYDAREFSSRLSEVLNRAQLIGATKLGVGQDELQQFVADSLQLAVRTAKDMTLLLTDDPIVVASAALNMNNNANRALESLIKLMKIDVTDVEDVDTLFDRIEMRLLQAQSDSREL